MFVFVTSLGYTSPCPKKTNKAQTKIQNTNPRQNNEQEKKRDRERILKNKEIWQKTLQTSADFRKGKVNLKLSLKCSGQQNKPNSFSFLQPTILLLEAVRQKRKLQRVCGNDSKLC